MRRIAIAALAGAALAVLALETDRARAQSAEPITLGELNSYSRYAAFTVPYRMGWQLALEEINEAGGVLGRPIEVVSRDDGGATADAVRVAEELLTREDAVLLFGTFLSNTGMAVADLANQRETLFLAAEPLTDALTMEAGNPYTYRVRPSTYMQTAMLVEKAIESGVKRWAIVAPNYEYGQAAARNFKELLQAEIPDAEIVAEQYPPLGNIDAGAVVQAVSRANPDGIFNVLFGNDLVQFVREASVRGALEGKTGLSLITGEPEWLLPLRGEVPEGWTVTGYPWEQIEDEKHQAFVDAYRGKYDETPRLGSLLGYICMYMIRDAFEAAGSTETEALQTAFEHLTTETPIGPISFRGIDNQSTMGAFVGELVRADDGNGRMVDWRYAPGEDHMVPEEEVRAARPDL